MAASLNLLSQKMCEVSTRNGFWDDSDSGKVPIDYMVSTKLALIHSEVSEALEAVRKPGQSEKVPQYTMLEEELADVFIRLFDLCGKLNIDVDGVVQAKSEYNKTRPYKHGKAM